MRKEWLLALSFVSGNLWAATSGESSFQLRDPKTKAVYYTGTETVKVDGANISRSLYYFDESRKNVLKENLRYNAETLKIEAFQSTNTQTGEESQLTPTDSGYDVNYRADAKKAASKFSATSDSFLPGLASDMILSNWDKLVSGKVLRFSLIVPSRGESLPFQLVRRETLTVDGESREVFALMPQNILIKSLAPHLEFQFSKDKKQRLATFPTTLPIKGGREKMVELVYSN